MAAEAVAPAPPVPAPAVVAAVSGEEALPAPEAAGVAEAAAVSEHQVPDENEQPDQVAQNAVSEEAIQEIEKNRPKQSITEMLVEFVKDANPPGSFFHPADDEQHGDEAQKENDTGIRPMCRPENLGDYYRRLRSFRPGWWFNKPLGVSPIECARRGWACIGPDRVRCECCGEELSFVREGQIWVVNGAPMKEAPTSKALIEAHSQFCPWRSRDVDVTNPGALADEELVSATEARRARLASQLHVVPVLAESGQVADKDNVFETLARAGWERLMVGKAPNELECLTCFYCQRTVAVQSFPHLEWVRQATEEPAEKKARIVAEDARGGSATCRPKAGLWTPRPWEPRSGSSPDSQEAVHFEPHACHHWYCPMYSQATHDLSPLAVRVVHAREAAAAQAAASSRVATRQAQESTTKKGAGGAAALVGAGGAAAARARELIVSLNTILPPP